MFFLLCSLVLAQDPGGIQYAPAGSLLVLPDGERLPVVTDSFLLPEAHYDTALVKARQLALCEPALDTCTEKALEIRSTCSDRLNTCLGQFDRDDELVQTLLADRNQWETRALVAETALKDARKDKWVAWAITGGLVLGATTVTTVTLAN